MNTIATLDRFDEQEIDEIFAPLNQCRKPGGAVGIAIGGTPVYRKGFGLAHIELPVLLSPTIRMRIGSTTKHFAAFAYMLLCEAGKAGIDDAIENHIPEIHAAAHGVTMRRLMGHTGGLRDSVAISMLTNGPAAPLTDAQMRAYYATIDDVDFAPGTAWSYNNGGYLLLTAVIERLAGRTLDEVLRTCIFQPLGMNDTLLRRWEREFVPNSATLHMIDAKGNFTRDYMGMEITGMGGIVSTMDDMLIWLKHMDAPTIGSAETWRLMREPHRLANGSSTQYGLGLTAAPYRGVETVHHGGGVLGGNSQMIKVPSAGLDITVAVNRADVRAVDFANRIIDLLVDGLEPEPEKADAEKATGVYISPTSGRVVELAEKEGIQLFSFDGLP
ncbi:MAG: serine hydrolase domain-containing protein, partial [Caulobacteraceae bacterium]